MQKVAHNALVQKIKPTVTASPHFRSPETSQGMMRDVIIALVPALIASVAIFGPRSLLINAVSIISCMLFEFGKNANSSQCTRTLPCFVEDRVATIGVCVFRCADFGWRTFLFATEIQKTF